MNKKLLIPVLLSILSGCVNYSVMPPLAAGGTDARSTNTDGLAKISDKSINTQNRTSNANSRRKTEVLDVPSVETDELKGDSVEKIEKFIPSSAKRYSNRSNKSIRSGAPASSAGNPSRYAVSGVNYKVLPFSNGFVERGIASWYGPDFHGEKTSNGERYNMYGMTAAHKRLPIPSYVKVTNLKNNRSVVLRVNDRGPYYADRVIDLSYAAAQKLGIHQPGTEMVQVEAIPTKTREKVYLQLGVFSNPDNAKTLQQKLIKNNMPQPTVKAVVIKGKLSYRVQLGPVFSTAKVNELNQKLAKMGISETWYITENKI
jgi:rare lipoprotein A